MLHASLPDGHASRIFAMGLLAVLLGCGAQHTEPNSTDRHSRPPILEVTPDPIVIELTEQLTPPPAKVTLRNASQQSFEVMPPTSSCTCTIVTHTRTQRLAPGESTVFEVTGHPPAYGEQTVKLGISTTHPELRIREVPVVLRGKVRQVPFVHDAPREMEINLRGAQESATNTFVITCAERSNSEPWLSGFYVDDENVCVSDPRITDGVRMNEDVQQRHYALDITANQRFCERNVIASLRFRVRDTFGAPTPAPVPIRVRYTPFLRVVPDTFIVSTTTQSLADSPREFLVFFDDDTRHPLRAADDIARGITLEIDEATAGLPSNATRVRLKFDPHQLADSNATPPIAISVVLAERSSVRATVRLKLRSAE